MIKKLFISLIFLFVLLAYCLYVFISRPYEVTECDFYESEVNKGNYYFSDDYAECYWTGYGRRLDKSKAIDILEKSYLKNSGRNEVNLLEKYIFDVERNYEGRIKEIIDGINDYDSKALYLVSVALFSGRGGVVDEGAAIKYMRRSADLGDIHAKYILFFKECLGKTEYSFCMELKDNYELDVEDDKYLFMLENSVVKSLVFTARERELLSLYTSEFLN